MTIESANYINQLNDQFPRADDLIAEGDDHIRMIKRALNGTFPGLTGPTNITQTQLNTLAGAFNDEGNDTIGIKRNIVLASGKGFNMGGGRIGNLGEPQNNTDAVTVAWVGAGYVAKATTVNGHPLTGNISISSGDIGLGNIPANVGVTQEATDNTLVIRKDGGRAKFVDVLITSDKRVKDNIVPIENALEKVNALGGYEYDKRTGEYIKHEAGVIAQEVQAVLPCGVSEDGMGYLSVSQSALIGLLVQAVKELTEKVERLEQGV